MDLRVDFSLEGIDLCNFIHLREEEALMIRDWRNNEGIRRWMYNDKLIEEKEHIDFIKGLSEKPSVGYWLVRYDDKNIGVLYITRLDEMNRNATFGIYGNPDESISGRGRILGKALKGLAFVSLKLHSLHLEVLETNKRAIGYYEKQGFQKGGALKEYVFRDGAWVDVLVMSMTEEEHEDEDS